MQVAVTELASRLPLEVRRRFEVLKVRRVPIAEDRLLGNQALTNHKANTSSLARMGAMEARTMVSTRAARAILIRAAAGRRSGNLGGMIRTRERRLGAGGSPAPRPSEET